MLSLPSSYFRGTSNSAKMLPMLQPSMSSPQASAPKFSGSIANASSMLYNSLPSTSTTIYTVGGLGLVFGAYKLLRGYFAPAEQPTSAKTQRRREIRKKGSPVKPSPNSQHSKTTAPVLQETGKASSSDGANRFETKSERHVPSPAKTTSKDLQSCESLKPMQAPPKWIPDMDVDVESFKDLQYLVNDKKLPIEEVRIRPADASKPRDISILTFHLKGPKHEKPVTITLSVNQNFPQRPLLRGEKVAQPDWANLGKHLMLNIPPEKVTIHRKRPVVRFEDKSAETQKRSQLPAKPSIDDLLKERPSSFWPNELPYCILTHDNN